MATTYECTRQASREVFRVNFDRNSAHVTDSISRNSYCENVSDANSVFDIVCSPNNQLIAYMYDGEEGAIVSSSAGIIDLLDCNKL